MFVSKHLRHFFCIGSDCVRFVAYKHDFCSARSIGLRFVAYKQDLCSETDKKQRGQIMLIDDVL